MSQKNRNSKAGRPKGLPKTGGRKPGTPNKANARLRTQFGEQGFDFVKEFITAFDELKAPEAKLDALLKMAPYFMQRLREDVLPVDPDKPDSEQETLRGIPTAELLNMLPGRPQGGH